MYPSKGFSLLIADSYLECFKSNCAEQRELSDTAMEMQNGSATVKTVWQVHTELNIYLHMTQQSYPWTFTVEK